jgi:hypothetical protein
MTYQELHKTLSHIVTENDRKVEPRDVVQQIHSTLSSRAFFNWYNSGNWDRYISGDPEAPSYFEIVDEIKSLFKIEG